MRNVPIQLLLKPLAGERLRSERSGTYGYHVVWLPAGDYAFSHGHVLASRQEPFLDSLTHSWLSPSADLTSVALPLARGTIEFSLAGRGTMTGV